MYMYLRRLAYQQRLKPTSSFRHGHSMRWSRFQIPEQGGGGQWGRREPSRDVGVSCHCLTEILQCSFHTEAF